MVETEGLRAQDIGKNNGPEIVVIVVGLVEHLKSFAKYIVKVCSITGYFLELGFANYYVVSCFCLCLFEQEYTIITEGYQLKQKAQKQSKGPT